MTTMPMVEANRLSKMLNLVYAGEDRFPVDIEALALEVSAQRFPDEPIVKISAIEIPGFEGVLARHPSQPKWKIGYNRTIPSAGRIRFTLAHEFGHYLLHRELKSNFQCTQQNMHEWDGAEQDIEVAADVFASYLLMPLDDFRRQLAGQAISIDLLLHLGDRYGVSPMAAALKWVEIEPKRMVVVAVRDGHVLWARSSQSAFRSGVYLASRKQLIKVPTNSLLNTSLADDKTRSGTQSARLWFGREAADVALTEHIHVSAGKYPYTLGLLVLPDAAPRWEAPDDELLSPLDLTPRSGSTRA
jgi:Zn-dependent peptidase ImmA (M78 family)